MFIHVDPNSRLAKVILVVAIPIWAILLWLEMDEFALSYRSTNWPVANGTILKSKVETHTDMHGISHSTAKIDYAYAVQGQRFENHKIAFGLGRGELTWRYAARKVAAWPQGKAAAVHYDPADPRVSCLESGGCGWEDCAFVFIACLGLVLGSRTACVAVGRVWARWQLPHADLPRPTD
jgi:hypothetical protein